MKQKILFIIQMSILLVLLSACSSKQTEVIHSTEGVMPISEPSLSQSTLTLVNVVTDSITAPPAPVKQSLKDKLLARIIKKDSSLADKNVDVVSEDYDGNGTEEYYYIFTEKGASKDDPVGNLAKIWFGNKAGVSQVTEAYISLNNYGTVTLANKKYFRYDLAFVTTSQTQLLTVKDNKFSVAFNSPGYVEASKNGRNFTVLYDSYDMTRSKWDDILCGHTWKLYYFYADKKGFHEYGGVKISKKAFLKYPGAADILKNIRKEYDTGDNKLTYRFIRRSNKLLHINICSETEDDITYSYQTYVIKKDALEILESDFGNYVTAIMPDIAVYH